MAGKCLKIFVEVGLIIVVRLVRDPRPIERLHGVNLVENLLKAVDTRQGFGGAADDLVELGDQMLLADADPITQIVDR